MEKKSNFLTDAQRIERDLNAIRDAIRRPLQSEFARGGLTGPQKAAMRALVHSEGMSLKELSVHLGLAHSTVSGIVDRLEKRGLVKRQESKDDHRITRIVVTLPVRRFVQNTMPRLLLHPIEQALSSATPRERKAIVNGIHTLQRLLNSN